MYICVVTNFLQREQPSQQYEGSLSPFRQSIVREARAMHEFVRR